jgi:hypothetical protein
LVSDIRVDDLQKNIGQVHDKLDRFKPKGLAKFVLAPLFTPNHIESAVVPVEVEFQVQTPPHLPHSWPELNFQPVEVSKSTRPLRKRLPAPADANTSSQAFAEPSVEVFVPAATIALTAPVEASVEVLAQAATLAPTTVAGGLGGAVTDADADADAVSVASRSASALARPQNKKWLKLLGGSTVALVLPLGFYA